MTTDTRSSELDDYLAAHPETRYLETLSPDMNGILRGKRAERHDFRKLFGNGMNLCAATAVARMPPMPVVRGTMTVVSAVFFASAPTRRRSARRAPRAPCRG